MSSNEVNSILEKLRKLKNIEEGARSVGGFEEAANAAGKYQDMLLKYNLSEEQVKSHRMEQKIRMLESILDCKRYEMMHTTGWVEKLVKAVAHSCMCRVVNLKSVGKVNKSILGEEHNVASALYIIEQLVSKISIALEFARKRGEFGGETRAVFSRGFLIGAVDAIITKLNAQERDVAKPNTEMGLMVINKRELATRFMMDKYKHLRTVGEKKVSNGSQFGYMKGHEAGSNMDINKGTNFSPKKFIGR